MSNPSVPSSPPAPPPAPRQRSADARARSALSFGHIPDRAGHRVVLFGPGGIGKTTVAATAPAPVAFFDLDESLPRLKRQLDEMQKRLDKMGSK